MSIPRYQNIHFIPSIHQRMVFAGEVRRAVDALAPDGIAVELPPALSQWIVRGVLRLPQISAVCYPSPKDDGEMFQVPIDPCDSLIEAVRLGVEREIEIEWIDEGVGASEAAPLDLPDDLTVERAGLERYVETVLAHLPASALRRGLEAQESERREAAMASRLAQLARRRERVLCVLGLAHYPGVLRHLEKDWDKPNETGEAKARPIEGAFLAHLDKASLPETFIEIPYAVYQREAGIQDAAPGASVAFDKLDHLRTTLKRAERRYRDQYKSEISVTQMKAMFQFTRNMAMTRGRLQPDAYELVMGAKGTVDGDYGYEVYELARSYPFQEEGSLLPKLALKDGRGTFDDREEKYRMARYFGARAMETVAIGFRRRPTLEMKREWAREWEQSAFERGICSWPPEDERQEKFMMFLRKKALQITCEDKRQAQQFTTSMLDGLDIRETMRNWHTQKVFVHQAPQPHGRVGAVVVVFVDERFDAGYPWRLTLYAENQNESDISFYATSLGDNVVGPRICKTEFGGVLSIYPATGIPDIWSFADVDHLERCADVLLAAGIVFSEDRFIAYIDRRPPSSTMRDLAARHKKQIVYLPIQSFAEGQLRKMRYFHILSGRDVRNYAAEYIFAD